MREPEETTRLHSSEHNQWLVIARAGPTSHPERRSSRTDFPAVPSHPRTPFPPARFPHILPSHATRQAKSRVGFGAEFLSRQLVRPPSRGLVGLGPAALVRRLISFGRWTGGRADGWTGWLTLKEGCSGMGGSGPRDWLWTSDRREVIFILFDHTVAFEHRVVLKIW